MRTYEDIKKVKTIPGFVFTCPDSIGIRACLAEAPPHPISTYWELLGPTGTKKVKTVPEWYFLRVLCASVVNFRTQLHMGITCTNLE